MRINTMLTTTKEEHNLFHFHNVNSRCFLISGVFLHKIPNISLEET